MRLYAQLPERRFWQVIADLAAIAVLAVSILVAVIAFNAIAALASIGAQIAGLGHSLSGTFEEAADALGGVPIVGGGLRGPFDELAQTAGGIIAAGESQQTLVQQLAWIVAIAIVLLPIALLIAVWLVPRIRGARRAADAARLGASAGGQGLLALRAIAGQAPARLLQIAPDPVAALARDDRDVIAALANLELRTVGLRSMPPLASVE